MIIFYLCLPLYFIWEFGLLYVAICTVSKPEDTESQNTRRYK